MPNEQIFSHHHFDYHSLMRVPSVCAMCVRSVCVECVWSVVRFQFRGSSACKMDQRSARFTDPTTHPCHVAMPGQIPNQSIAASARTHTHVHTCGAYCGTAGHLDLGQRYWQLAETNNWRVLCAASKLQQLLDTLRRQEESRAKPIWRKEVPNIC